MPTLTVTRPISNGRCSSSSARAGLAGLCFSALGTLALSAASSAAVFLPAPVKSAVGEYCLDCHDGAVKKGDFDLGKILGDDIALHSSDWERVVRKMAARQMPPVGKDRPSEKDYERLVAT